MICSVIASSMELLNLYLALTAPSVIFDIVRLATTPKPHPSSFGFSVFLFVLVRDPSRQRDGFQILF